MEAEDTDTASVVNSFKKCGQKRSREMREAVAEGEYDVKGGIFLSFFKRRYDSKSLLVGINQYKGKKLTYHVTRNQSWLHPCGTNAGTQDVAFRRALHLGFNDLQVLCLSSD